MALRRATMKCEAGEEKASLLKYEINAV